MNIITFNKVITNYTKLERELRASSVYGSVYNFMSLKGSELNLHFTQNLTQAQIDALSAYVAAYSDISVFDNLVTYLGREIDPFVLQLMTEIRAANIEMGITVSGKTAEVLGFFQQPITLPGKVRPVTLQSSLDTSSLTVTVELLTYLIANESLYADLSPFVTAARLDAWKTKILARLSA